VLGTTLISISVLTEELHELWLPENRRVATMARGLFVQPIKSPIGVVHYHFLNAISPRMALLDLKKMLVSFPVFGLGCI